MISINVTGGVPIYEQICAEISRYIARGDLKEDDKLPGARVLAKTLGINPNTIAKAYSRLEHDEIIYSIQGKGCFVAKQKGSIEKKLTDEFCSKAQEALKAGISAKTLIEKINELNSDKRGKEND